MKPFFKYLLAGFILLLAFFYIQERLAQNERTKNFRQGLIQEFQGYERRRY